MNVASLLSDPSSEGMTNNNSNYQCCLDQVLLLSYKTCLDSIILTPRIWSEHFTTELPDRLQFPEHDHADDRLSTLHFFNNVNRKKLVTLSKVTM